MSYINTKMHQIQFQLGLCRRPCWRAYSVPPDHPGQLSLVIPLWVGEMIDINITSPDNN